MEGTQTNIVFCFSLEQKKSGVSHEPWSLAFKKSKKKSLSEFKKDRMSDQISAYVGKIDAFIMKYPTIFCAGE